MRILVGCEKSQAVTIALRKQGHDAYSCDLLPESGGYPEWHLQMDVFAAIKLNKWDAGIFFPTCTYLAVSANRWYKDQPKRKSGTLVGEERREAREEAVKFFVKLYNCDIPQLAIENPIGVMSSRFRKPDQVLQPWMFGHGETKATCLWLKNLQKLEPTNIVDGRVQRMFLLPKTKDRACIRGKTYNGIAEAMATQWFCKNLTIKTNKRGEKMTFTEAKKTLMDMANGRFCTIDYEQEIYSNGNTRPECSVYIEGACHVGRSTWGEALNGLRAVLDGKNSIDNNEAPE